MDASLDPERTITTKLTVDMSDYQRDLRTATQLGRQFSHSLISAFEGIAIKGRSASDVLKSFALSLSSIVLKAALKPLEQGIGSIFTNLFAGGGFAFAKGGVLQAGTPVPFARGGVIASPVTFPLAGGRTGLMGERGAEAIMPLARGADGRLGVVAQGSGAANVTINIATPDVESFQRSQAQVAAMLARAVTMGQRNL